MEAVCQILLPDVGALDSGIGRTRSTDASAPSLGADWRCTGSRRVEVGVAARDHQQPASFDNRHTAVIGHRPRRIYAQNNIQFTDVLASDALTLSSG